MKNRILIRLSTTLFCGILVAGMFFSACTKQADDTESQSGDNIPIEYGDDIVNHILDIVKDEKDYGARPIVRAIQDVIENKITDALLEKDYDNGYKFKISCSPSGDVTVA